MQRTTFILAATGAAAIANAQIGFAPRADFSTPNRPSGIAAADFTGDGVPDLAVIADDRDRVIVLAGDGAGGFVAGPVTFLGSGTGADAVIHHDIDGDGNQDLVIVFDGPNTAQAWLNDGAGGFAPGASASTGIEPVWITKGNLNGNRDADFVVVNRDSNSVSIILDLGVATAASQLAVGLEPRTADIADFDGDGNADLVVTSHDDRTIRILGGNGAGGFTPGQVITTPAQRPEGVVAADFDGDRDMDLAATVDNAVRLYINTGGVFAGGALLPVGSVDPSAIYIGDFAAGGPGPDLLTINDDGGSISVFENFGSGAFGTAQVFSTGISPQFAAVGDFDRSGTDDIAVTNRDSNTTSVFLNRDTALPCPADFDGDGEVNLFDFLAFQIAFDLGRPAADIDGDGMLTVFDFLAFQNLFVLGCP
ncbi:MAG: FG-GAP-like repeat-containing protein [Planctomycetota bacterium]